MHCASCGFANPEGMEFCTECGTRLQNTCPQCQFANALQAKFCGNCGTSLTARQKAKSKRQKANPPSHAQRLASGVQKDSEFRVRSSGARPIASGGGSRSLLPQSHRDCSATAGEVAGAAGSDELESAVAKPGEERRSSADAGVDLQLVHRRV